MSHTLVRSHVLRLNLSLIYSTAVVSLAAAANAQTLPQAQADTPPPAATSGVEEIVVTAQKRSENLQKVPLAVTAISPATLESFAVTDVRGIQAFTAGVRLGTNAASTQINIRGIGNTNESGNGDPAAAFNLDGVYLARTQSSTNILFDIERVEVLRGPQGTLYGRNADAGAINVITNKPTFTLGGMGEIEAGNYGLHRETGALNVPLSDTLAVRGAVQFINRDGYVSNGTSDADSQAGRLHLLWKPDAATSVLLSGDYSHRGGLGSQQLILLSPLDTDHPWRTAIPSDGFKLDGTTWGTTLNLNHDFGGISATVIAAHRDERDDQRGSAAGTTYQSSLEHSRANSVEARLGSSGRGPFVWTAGLYYFREAQNYFLNVQAAPGVALFTNYPSFTTSSAAAFGQATYAILPTLRLTAGGRYTRDHKDIGNGTFGTDVFLGVGSNATGPILSSSPVQLSKTWRDFSWKLGAETDIAPNVLGYISASKGYKSGGFFAGLPPTNTYDPEKLYAYAVGVKSRLFDGKVQFNAEGFYWNYKDYQVQSLGILPSPPNPPGAFTLLTYNSGRATIYGLETETVVAPTRNDQINVTLSYLHGKFDQFVVPGLPGPATGDFSGSSLPHSPKFSGTVGYRHTFRLDNGGQLQPAAQMHFETKQRLLYWYKNVPQGATQGAYTTSDLSLTYILPGARWRVSAYVKNVENSAVVNVSAESPSQMGSFYGELNPPRTYGGTLSFTW